MKRCIVAFCVAALLASSGVASAQGMAGANPEAVQAQLETFVQSYLAGCNRELRPGKAQPALAQRDGKIVATYIELDPRSARTELYPASGESFSYLAKLTYVEHTYEAVGNSPEEAATGVYRRVKSRRLTELPRYIQGRWEN